MIYPTEDSLPENLLKIYLRFSEPMVEGNSLKHVSLLKNDIDTMKGIFLDLHPELWNEDGTVLTLWLDPGRIKRDLIPNKEFGSPLVAGNGYTLHVSDSWKSKNGQTLAKPYTKSFHTVLRDDTSPQLIRWKITPPKSKTKHGLKIQLFETLDYFILMEGIKVLNSEKKIVDGVVKIAEDEKVVIFLPTKPWNAGKFTLSVEARLEDLSGNNLNRPFDKDVDQKIQNQIRNKEIFFKEFEIP